MNQEEQWLLREKYGGEKTAGFFTDLERLKTGEPLGYVIGWTPFLGCKIWLDNQPLIPRTETEFWVANAIIEIEESISPRPGLGLALGRASGQVKILDLCAGSGAIGAAVAKAIPEVHVTLAEIDKTLLPTIGKNLKENNIDCTHSQVFDSDLFSSLSGKFDFILSNPPYIDPELDRTEKSVRKYEPHLALYGGRHGLELIEKIIVAAPTYLNPRGQLWLEHEPEQAQDIAELGQEHGFVVTSHEDQYQVVRYSTLMLK